MPSEEQLFRCLKSNRTIKWPAGSGNPLDHLLRWARHEPSTVAVAFTLPESDKFLVRSYGEMLRRVLAAYGSMEKQPAGPIGIVAGQHVSTLEAAMVAIAAKREFVLIDPLSKSYDRELSRLRRWTLAGLVIPALEEMPTTLVDRLSWLTQCGGQAGLWSLGFNPLANVDLLGDDTVKPRMSPLRYLDCDWRKPLAHLYPRQGDCAYSYTPRALSAGACAVSRWLKLEERTRILCGVNIDRVEGLMLALASVMSGATCIMPVRIDAENFWRHATESAADLARVDPELIENLLDRPPRPADVSLNRLKYMVVDAGRLSAKLTSQFFDSFEIPLIHCFGTPQTGGYALGMPVDLPRCEYEFALRDNISGQELDFCNVRIDVEQGSGARSRDRISEGLLAVRGLSVSSGCCDGHDYRPWDSAWLATTALATSRPAHGRHYYTVHGLTDESVTIKGYRLWPSQVERSLLETFAFLDDCVVVARSDAAGVDELCAVLMLPQDCDHFRRSELLGLMQARLAAGAVDGLNEKTIPGQLIPLPDNQIPKDEDGRPDRTALQHIINQHERDGRRSAS